jgi:Na+-transporting NADH:ubiquinone oxidoreductase subunit A
VALHKITKGLTLPITGQPRQEIEDAPPPRRVALLGEDYIGMKPTMHVAEGDTVQRGQLVFEDKKIPGVRFTAPGSGKVVAVNRGDRRRFLSLVIELDEDEKAGKGSTVKFESFTGKEVGQLDREQVKTLLLESGLWTALRRRPFSRTAFPEETPDAIFVTAMDSNPLAPSPEVILAGQEEDFQRGVEAVAKLTEGATYVCCAPGANIPVPAGAGIQREDFAGPHPAGTVGVHIHTLAPVDRKRVVWHLGYQDAVAIGHLFRTGELAVGRVVAVAGPAATDPRLLRTRLGASVDELVAGEVKDGEIRFVSGPVFSGTKAQGDELGYLGRFHNQISLLEEGRNRDFLAWMGPGTNLFSVTSAFLSKLIPGKKFAFTTNTNGSPRAIVPIGLYEQVMPMDLMPTFLLKALVMEDLERAEELGCLELDEEDLALCTFVCPGKTEYGPYLRKVLTTMEKEG